MNLLIIGNGFDLAHSLPTDYKHFLDFTRGFNVLFHNIDYDGIHKELENVVFHPMVERYLDYIWTYYTDLIGRYNVKYTVILNKGKSIPDNDSINITSSKKTINEYDLRIISCIEAFKKLLYRNYWIMHYYDVVLERNWVDFETELSKIVGVLEYLIGDYKEDIDENKDIAIDVNSEVEELFDFYFDKGLMAELALGSIKTRYKRTTKTYPTPGGKGVFSAIKISSVSLKDLFEIRNVLQIALENLTFAFELYLSEVVDHFGLKIISCQKMFKNLNVDRVISFNYTHTWERLYSSSEQESEIEYIHGEVAKTPIFSNCKLVLGMNEAMEVPSASETISVLKFKKYYQRIRKNTGREYKEWINALDIENGINEKNLLENMPKDNNSEFDRFLESTSISIAKVISNRIIEVLGPTIKRKRAMNNRTLSNDISKLTRKAYEETKQYIERVSCVYIFGHSLDVTDKDVLKEFIDYDWIKVIVFYRNEKDLDKKIENLIRIIGRQKLIERRGGRRQTIFFYNINTGIVI